MRVGVIGFGKAGRQHADAARRSGEAELVAVADPAPAAAQAADALGVRCWPDYEAMLDAIDLDAVVVSLPHAALPAAALAAAAPRPARAAGKTDGRDEPRRARGGAGVPQRRMCA